MTLSLPIEPEATKLLYDSPLALILAMLLDQQIPMEKAFSSPYVLKQRLGHDLDAQEIAAFDPEAFEAILAKPPALHRFPKANAKRAQELCQVLVERYDGDAAKLWTGVEDRRGAGGAGGAAARVRQAEVADLRGAAGQAVRHPARGLAGGDRRVRRGGLASGPSPTSPTRARWPRSASTSRP